MNNIVRHTIGLRTGSASGVTAYSSAVLNGFVWAWAYASGTASNLATAASITITGENSSFRVFGASGITSGSPTYYPRAKVVDTSGGALLYSSNAGGPPIETLIPLVEERAKVVVSSGGADKLGTVYLYMAGR